MGKALAAACVSVAVLAGIVTGPGQADAKVAAGTYRWCNITENHVRMPVRMCHVVTVRNGRVYLTRDMSSRITSTPTGGYSDWPGVRCVVRRTYFGYRGTCFSSVPRMSDTFVMTRIAG